MRVIAALLLITTCVAFGGVAFGINPIGPLRESYVGYRAGLVLPYASVNFYNGSYSYKERDEDYPEYSDTINASAGVLVPTLGTRFLFGSSDLRPFIRLSAGIPLLLYLTARVNDPDWQDEIDDDLEEFRDGIELTILATAGAGAEYFFGDNFSLGGEFKYNYVTTGGEWEVYTDEFLNLRGNLGGTCTSVWFNFYF